MACCMQKKRKISSRHRKIANRGKSVLSDFFFRSKEKTDQSGPADGDETKKEWELFDFDEGVKRRGKF